MVSTETKIPQPEPISPFSPFFETFLVLVIFPHSLVSAQFSYIALCNIYIAHLEEECGSYNEPPSAPDLVQIVLLLPELPQCDHDSPSVQIATATCSLFYLHVSSCINYVMRIQKVHS